MPMELRRWGSLLAAVFAALLLSWAQCGLSAADLGTNPLDVETLNNIKQAFKSPLALRSWRGTNPCAKGNHWRGVDCHVGPARTHYVTALYLPNSGLEGKIPESLGNLAGLRVLDLSNNHLDGPLPLTIGLLRNLTILRLHNNSLVGPIPLQIRNIKNLRELSLAHNGFHGSIRNDLLQLHNLQQVLLNDNKLSGNLPRYLTLRQLIEIDLSNNRLQGPLPWGLFRSNQLTRAVLSNNKFSGPIPRVWGGLRVLKGLWMSSNMLNGSIPEELSNCTTLKILDLQDNRLSGSVPPGLSHITGITLLVMNNNLTGFLKGPFKRVQIGFSGNPLLCADFNNDNVCDPRLPSQGGPITTPQQPPPDEQPQPPPEGASPPPNNDNSPPGGEDENTGGDGETGGGNGGETGGNGETGGDGKTGGETDAAGGSAPPVDEQPAAPAAAAAAVCVAGTVEACVCSNGLAGQKTCEDGTVGFGECVCAKAAPSSSGDSSVWKFVVGALCLLLGALVAVAGYFFYQSGAWRRKGAGWDYVGRVSRAFPDMRAYRSHAYDPDDLDTYGVPAFDALPKHPAEAATASSAAAAAAASAAAKKGGPKLTLTRFSLEELQLATNNFNIENVISTDGVCRTFSGVLPSGLYVAVKELDPLAHESDDAFVAAAEMFSGVRCPQLVEVLGVCAERSGGGTGRRHHLLVYELVPNGSLDMHMHDLEPGTLPLDWTTRMCISLDVAKGLAYVHSLHPQLMHEGLQATCVVLDDHFHAKLADYCLHALAANSSGASAAARTSALSTSVNMAVAAGTAAPELAWASEMTPRVDVYAFGVLLLEVVTGRRPVDNMRPPNEQSLVHWAKSRLSQRSLVEAMVDDKLHGSISTAALYQVAMLASQCIHSDPEARPTMAQAVDMLAKVQNLPLDSSATRQGGGSSYKGSTAYNKNA